jgi:hypothetical protein
MLALHQLSDSTPRPNFTPIHPRGIAWASQGLVRKMTRYAVAFEYLIPIIIDIFMHRVQESGGGLAEVANVRSSFENVL